MTLVPRSLCRRLAHSLCIALLYAGPLLSQARAGFVEDYSITSFTLGNVNADGDARTSAGGATLIITGPNDGSGLPGHTNLTTPSRGIGAFSFDFEYTSLDGDDWD